MSNRELETSILNLSDVHKRDITKRIDSEYFQNKYLEMDDGRYSKVLHYCNDVVVKGGKRLPQGHDFSTKQGTPYIRAQELRNSFVLSSNAPLIAKSTLEKLSNYKIENNKLIINAYETFNYCMPIENGRAYYSKTILPNKDYKDDIEKLVKKLRNLN